MKVKSESEVAQSCPTLSDPMDCGPPGSPVPGILQEEHWSGCHCLLACTIKAAFPTITATTITVCETSTVMLLTGHYCMWGYSTKRNKRECMGKHLAKWLAQEAINVYSI